MYLYGLAFIVLSERDGSRKTEEQGVLCSNTWRVADLATKHAFLLGGLGWGNMPEHMVKKDIASGRLVRLEVAAWGDDELCLRDLGEPSASHG